MDKLLTFMKEKSCWDRIAVSEDEIPDPACVLKYIIDFELVSGFHEDTDPVIVSSHG